MLRQSKAGGKGAHRHGSASLDILVRAKSSHEYGAIIRRNADQPDVMDIGIIRVAAEGFDEGAYSSARLLDKIRGRSDQ